MVQAAKTPKELEALSIWEAVTRLAKDPIVDVRIGVARLVANATGKFLIHRTFCITHGVPERLYPRRSRRWKLMKSLLRSLGADKSAQVKSFVSFLTDEGDVTTPQGSSYNESGFAIFSKPPRTTNQRLMDSPGIDAEIDNMAAAVAEKMDLDQPCLQVPSIVTEPAVVESGEASNSTQGQTGGQPLSSSMSLVLPSRPPLLNADSTETTASGTSRGEESLPSPRVPSDGESPRPRKNRRNNHIMTLSDLPQAIELSEAYQHALLTA